LGKPRGLARKILSKGEALMAVTKRKTKADSPALRRLDCQAKVITLS
jgi:hypothetical protein